MIDPVPLLTSPPPGIAPLWLSLPPGPSCQATLPLGFRGSGPVISLLQDVSCLPTACRIKSKFLSAAHKVLYKWMPTYLSRLTCFNNTALTPACRCVSWNPLLHLHSVNLCSSFKTRLTADVFVLPPDRSSPCCGHLR